LKQVNWKSDFTTPTEAKSNILKTDPPGWKTHYRLDAIRLH